MPVSSNPAPLPHDLDLVIDFVNTFEPDTGDEAFEEAAALTAWLHERALLRQPTGGDERSLARARALREALRTVMVGHNGGDQPPAEAAAAAAELQAVAQRGGLTVRFAPDGSVDVVATDPGLDGALARLLIPVAGAAADGSWARVKACAAGDCRWAFYDRSRNRSGRWCDMAECGNRAKVRAYRSRRSP